MTEGFRTTKVIKIQRLDTTQCLVITLSTYRTENLAVIIGQQLIEDVDAEIACGTCQQHITDGLTLTLPEGCEGVRSK